MEARMKLQLENMESLIVFSCVIALFVCAWRALNFLWWRPRNLEKYLKSQGLHGNSYKPFSGDYKEMVMMIEEAKSKPINLSDDILPRIVPFFLETIKKYGRDCFIWRGPKPAVIILDPQLMREILQNNYLFRMPETNPISRLFGQGLVTYNGDKWAKHRKIISPAFHQEKLKKMVPAFHHCASEMLTKWMQSISPEGSCELDVWPYLQTLTADAISRTAFGSNYEEGKRIFQLQSEQVEHVITVLQSFYFPGLRFFPTKRNRRMKDIAKQIEAAVKGIIDKRVEAMKAGEPAKNDLLSTLLESNYGELSNKNSGMSTKEIVDECKVFYFAGQETTTSLLAWTMVLLSRHQEWQSRAREEVLQVFGRGPPTFDGLNHLKIMTMVLNEVLRLYTPSVLRNLRIHEKTKVGKFTLPAGVDLTLPLILLHHDPEIWGNDAKEFNPERFSDGVSKASNGQLSFFPFGGGPRVCIGQNFAMLEAKLAMAMILQRFSFELSPSYTHAPLALFIIQPQHGVHLILRKLEA